MPLPALLIVFAIFVGPFIIDALLTRFVDAPRAHRRAIRERLASISRDSNERTAERIRAGLLPLPRR